MSIIFLICLLQVNNQFNLFQQSIISVAEWLGTLSAPFCLPHGSTLPFLQSRCNPTVNYPEQA